MNHQPSRKKDLVALANFGAQTNRRWLVRDALLAMQREHLMTADLSHIAPDIGEDLFPLVAEALRPDVCWVVADAYDALRLESYGFPALATEDKTSLPISDLNGCRWVILLQRPGEEETLAGVDVRAELLRLGWKGTLTSILLPFADLDEAEEECGGERFGVFLVNLIAHATTHELTSDGRHPLNGEASRTVSETSWGCQDEATARAVLAHVRGVVH